MTPSRTPASSVATTHGTHDLKTAGRASTTAATETPKFSVKIVAIHSLNTPAREPKLTSTQYAQAKACGCSLSREVGAGKDRANIVWQSTASVAPSA